MLWLWCPRKAVASKNGFKGRNTDITKLSRKIADNSSVFVILLINLLSSGAKISRIM
jgi:hypothetical protein